MKNNHSLPVYSKKYLFFKAFSPIPTEKNHVKIPSFHLAKDSMINLDSWRKTKRF